MKIFDRYVIGTFLKNYLISFMVLVGMYVVLDMVFNFNHLVEVQPGSAESGAGSMLGAIANVADYYFYQGFLFFVHLSGIIPVVAAAFTLMRLSRFNELTAVLAAGVPLLRVAMPIILAAVVLNALLIVDQELLIPHMIPKLTRKHDDMHRGGPEFQNVQAMQDEEASLLYAAQYAPPTKDQPATMKKLDVILRDADLQPVGKISAEAGRWNERERKWELEKGTLVRGLRYDEVPTRPQEVTAWRTSISPEEIALYRSSEYVEFLPTRRIDEMLKNPKSYGANNLLRVKHWRFTQPLMNVILLLLAIPCVLTREPGRLKAAAAKSLFWTGIGMGSIFVAHHLAGKPPTPSLASEWPAIMAWVPIFVFGPIAVFFLDRVKT